ncbi:CAMP factor family pore-forming toxin [Mobiluncus mulieris]|uniref:CAMP factor family pore-forming toxin n=1 Tax=Mobiluncus mulieris TaxID=2052 RepID=UPI0024321C76|nr:CAMP factor family pore-forming toxin [Mobiluncus mulieris]
MNKKFIGFALAASLVLPGLAAPTVAFAADDNTNTTVAAITTAPETLTRTTAAEYLNQINNAIANVQEAQKNDPQADWGKEISKLLSTAAELSQVMESVAQHGMNLADADLEIARAQLVVEIGSTIKKSSDNLRYKIQKAHVELGFAVTRAIIRVANIGAKTPQLLDSIKDLQETYERVSTYPELTATSRANFYIKNGLNKFIWKVRVARDKNILGKKPYKVYRQLNREITKAVGVWFRARATVQDVANAVERLDNAYKTALNS